MTVQTAGAQNQKGYKGIAMEGQIATWYARNTRARMDEQAALAQMIAARVPQGGSVLEVAPGPGYLSVALAQLGKQKVTGLEISETFVRIERENAAEAGVSVDFNHGDAARMPFEANRFDFIVCVAAFKNFTFPVQALNEFHRVLRPGGTALINDLRRDAPRDAIAEEVKRMQLNAVNAFFTRVTFSQFLLKNAYTRAEIKALAAQTAFQRADVQIDGISLNIWLTKQPE